MRVEVKFKFSNESRMKELNFKFINKEVLFEFINESITKIFLAELMIGPK